MQLGVKLYCLYNFSFLRHAIRINDEHERDQLLEEEPRIALNPHQPPAGDVHENVPEITAGSFFRKQIGPDEESRHESNFQPLVDGSDTTEVAIQFRQLTKMITHGGKPTRYTAHEAIRHFRALALSPRFRACSENERKILLRR